REGARVDAPGRPHVREDEDPVHRRGRPRIPGHRGVEGPVRREAVQDGRVVRQGDPDHPSHRGRGEVRGSDPRLDDARAGVPGRVPLMSFADEMRSELAKALKAHVETAIPDDELPDVHSFEPAPEVRDLVAVDGSYNFLLNISSWWLALVSVALLRYRFDGGAYHREDWRLVQRAV